VPFRYTPHAIRLLLTEILNGVATDGESDACFKILGGFDVCGGYFRADGPKIAVQCAVGGVQNEMAVGAIL
jgi:hypothetical protein